ncbi:arsenic transporter [Neobacillus piezotolerans]|uniref:Arsenic transporter n=1 Tax=Neobacillus piezotolerans TaxID=2259171 RepID=A0A3D8GMR5_9BACI|nr:arsenic transporter [Neobacillus piezotolerans]
MGSFVLTMLFIFWRPKGLNEAIPSTFGAIAVIIWGNITLANLMDISSKVSGAAITIISTIVMVLVLESVGFFKWAIAVLSNLAQGNGRRLFWLTNLFCFLMTVFFNNDGSILITTPILILLLKKLKLKRHQKIPYLLSGALIATASSAPIGVSNIVNLIALKIIGMDLYLHTLLMFIPGILGLLFLLALLFLVFRKDIPRTIPPIKLTSDLKDFQIYHPLQDESLGTENKKQKRIMVGILIFVFMIRLGLFIASYFGIPMEIVAVLGSIILLGWRWAYLKVPPSDMLAKTPWHILIFAYTMYILIYGLHNIGLTDMLIFYLHSSVSKSLFHASLVMGGTLSIISNLFNNHPALMIGTLALTNMGLDPVTIKTVYLANIIGSDIGSLFLPIGTLATLMWMHILKREKVGIHWFEYIKVTVRVIPPTVLFTLVILFLWIELVYN